MRTLSKSKLIAFRQCPKRMWLELYKPELREDSAQTLASFAVGNEVGTMARRLYDPGGKGALIDIQLEGFTVALQRSSELLRSNRPIFEAGFSAAGGVAFADVMLPVRKGGKLAWRMLEVKSSTKVTPYQRDDLAVQAFVARSAGIALASTSIAYVDTSWVYAGDGEYRGLLKEEDLTAEASARHDEVSQWIGAAQMVAALVKEPTREIGSHCSTPYACGFQEHCRGKKPEPKHPLAWLPNVQTKVLKAAIHDGGLVDMKQVPDALLNERQLRVKQHTLSGKVFFDRRGAANDLAAQGFPATFLDFETISLAVPIWIGIRPYQAIPFQFSVHRVSRTDKLDQQAFLDLSGDDPSYLLATALLDACRLRGPIYAYGAAFEKNHINTLAKRFPSLRAQLLALNARVVDLLPIAQHRYYHPSQCGTWSIKQVLPAIAPDLSYGGLNGVQDGNLAMEAFREAINPRTTLERKAEIGQQLLAYCRLDTYAMVKIWAQFAGRKAPLDA